MTRLLNAPKDIGPAPSKLTGPWSRHFVNSVAFASLLLASPAVTAREAPLPTQIVDLGKQLSGPQPGFRTFHAKGAVVEGSFKASPEAAGLSRATLFDGRTVQVTARFSDGSGMPNEGDGSPGANPHGLAIKYHLPGGADTDMVTNSLKFFPVGTGEEFRDMLLAIIASPPDAAKPTKLDQFFANHPNAPKAFGTAATPDSFADEEYHGINAFILVNKAGQRQAVRYLLVPDKLAHLTPDEAAKQPPNFLFDDLSKRIVRPIVFHVRAQLAEPADQTKDASQPWADDRKIVELGVLTLNRLVPDSLEAQKKLLFVPTNLTDGIELSDDPLPVVRAAAYGVSFARRSQ